jgi:hypothetical protein
MPVQGASDYNATHDPGFEGQKVDLQLTNIVSKVAEGGDIPFGRAVVQGTADAQAKLPSATGQTFLGITEMTTAWAENASNLHVYDQYREMSIIDFGEVWVYTEQSVVPGDAVYFRHTAEAAPLAIVGRFRKDSSGGNADLVQGAKWNTTTAAGAIGKIKLNAPGTGILLAPDSSETLTAAGAVVISVNTGITYFDSTLGAQAASLADGTEGQFKRLMMLVDGGDVTITPANLALGSTLKLTEVFDYIDLQFSGTSWKVVGGGNRAQITMAASGAIPLDVDTVLINSTSGVQALTLADGYEGQKITLKMIAGGNNSVLTPATLLDGTTITFTGSATNSAQIQFIGSSWSVIGTPTATVA